MKEIIDITPMSEEERFWASMEKALEAKAKENAKSLWVVNKERYNDMHKAYDLLKEIVTEYDESATFECQMNDIFPDVGEIAVYCTDLTVRVYSMDAMREVMNLVDNFEIVPATNDRIMIGLTFLNVMIKRK